MKLQVKNGKLLLTFYSGLHFPNEILKFLDFRRARLRCRICSGNSFEADANVKQVFDIMLFCNEAPLDDLPEKLAAVCGNCRSFTNSSVQYTHNRQASQCFAQRGAAHAKVLAEIAFRGQALTRFQVSVRNEIHDLLSNLFTNGDFGDAPNLRFHALSSG